MSSPTAEWQHRTRYAARGAARGSIREVVGSMGYMMDHMEVYGKVCSNMKSGVRELMKTASMTNYCTEHCSNMESGVRERAELETRELYSNMVYEVRRMVGIKEELWDRWYRASPKRHHL